MSNKPNNTDSYARIMAKAIIKGQYTLIKVETDLKCYYYGFIMYNKILKEIKKIDPNFKK